MPYISSDHRKPYAEIITRCASVGGSSLFEGFFMTLLSCLAERVYGSVETRYYKQNEFIGVLSCAATEWLRRTRCSDDGLVAESRCIDALDKTPPTLRAEAQALCGEITELLPLHDETQRAGHLNFVLTSILLQALTSGALSRPDQGFQILESFRRYWYGRFTADYEESMIAKNGDCYPAQLTPQRLPKA
ncbi:MAG: hypothetical protein J5J00_12530 [Deltaproteobacteria bacterium]|nr:hypothetical protein [Deltaproteobacteria bacterium]